MTSPSASSPRANVVTTTSRNRKRVQLPLPTELIYMTITIARPRSWVPAVCSQLHTVCATGHDVHIAWRNRVLLGDPDPDTGSSPDRSNPKSLLTSLLPDHGFPSTSQVHRDPILTAAYLRQLYTRTFSFPLHHQGAFHITTALDPNTAHLPDLDALFARRLPTDFHWWRPVTDALLLPAYLIRAGQLDLLSQCLELLPNTRAFQSLNHGSLCWAAWKALCIDKRFSIIQLFDADQFLSHRATYPLVLAMLALFEWSPPTLEVVLRAFHSHISPSLVAHTAFENTKLASVLTSLISQCIPDNAFHVVDLYLWLQRHGGQDLDSCLTLSKYLLRGDAPGDCVRRAVDEVDLPRWSLLLNTNPNQASLLVSGILDYVGKYDADDVFESLRSSPGFVMGLYYDWPQLVAWNPDKWWPVVQEHVQVRRELRFILVEGINYSKETSFPKASIAKCAHILQAEFDTDMIDLALDCYRGELYYFESTRCFTALVDTPLLPNLASALNRILAFLETPPRPTWAMERPRQHLCSLVGLLFFEYIARSPWQPIGFHPWLTALSPVHLAILVVAVLVTTALDDHVVNAFVSLDWQLAVAQALVMHACQVRIHSPTANYGDPVVPFFDLIPDLQKVIPNLIEELMSSSLDDIIEADTYICNMDFARQMVPLLSQLDLSFVALSVVFFVEEETERKLMPGATDLVPQDQLLCATMAYDLIAELAAPDGDPVATEYNVIMLLLADPGDVDRDLVFAMARRRLATDAFGAMPEGWKSAEWTLVQLEKLGVCFQ